MVGLDECDQLIVVHRHGYGEVNPTGCSDLERPSLHPGKLYHKIDVLDDENAH